MSLKNIPSDISIEIFKYLDISDLNSLHKTNKSMNYDIEKYSKQKFKNSWFNILKDKKCIHCKNLCDENNKICDECLCDTCWKCFNKVGNENLSVNYFTDELLNSNEEYLIICCTNGCKFNCCICKKKLNQYDVTIDTKKHKTYCSQCFNQN